MSIGSVITDKINTLSPAQLAGLAMAFTSLVESIGVDGVLDHQHLLNRALDAEHRDTISYYYGQFMQRFIHPDDGEYAIEALRAAAGTFFDYVMFQLAAGYEDGYILTSPYTSVMGQQDGFGAQLRETAKR